MKEKSVKFCFLKLKVKEKANFSKIIEGEEGDFYSFKVNVYSLRNVKQET